MKVSPFRRRRRLDNIVLEDLTAMRCEDVRWI
jgi:hypothetical protein